MEREYERCRGAEVLPKYKGMDDIPVPPRWVQERSPVPRTMKKLSWHAELEGDPAPEFRDTCVDYVKNWVDSVQYGENLVIADPRVSIRKTWAAAATMNELIRYFAPVTDLSAMWLSVRGYLPFLYRNLKKDSYGVDNYLSRITTVRLLVIDSLLEISHLPDVRWLVDAIYTRRCFEGLPTIVTLQADVEFDNWKAVTPVLGEQFTGLLYETTQYLARP